MKKVFGFVLVFIAMVTMITPVIAKPAEKEPKERPVIINGLEEDFSLTIKVGEEVDLLAEALKHGSDYTDSWTVGEDVLDSTTILNKSTGVYESRTTFSGIVPGIYEITYKIVMTAGKSGNSFVGERKVTIEVVGTPKVVGITLKDIEYRQNGKDNLHATGYLYTVLDNGEEGEYIRKVELQFNKNISSIVIEEMIDGVKYTITVHRPADL